MWSSHRMQNINYRVLTYFLPVPILVFYTLSLTGCVSESPGLPGIFTLRLTNNLGQEVRVGYFAMCISVSNTLNCQPTAYKDTETIVQVMTSNSAETDTNKDQLVNMVDIARKLQTTYVLCLLAAAGVLFVTSLLFLVLLKRDFKMPANNEASCKRRDLLRRATMSAIWTSVAFALASGVASDQTTNAVAFISQVDLSATSIVASPGKSLTILQWLALSCSVLYGAGVSNIFVKEGGTIHSTGSAKVEYSMQTLSAISIAPPPAGIPPPPLLPPPPPPPPAVY